MKKVLYISLILLFGFTLCNAAGNKGGKGSKGNKAVKAKYENPLFNAIVRNNYKELATILNEGTDVNAKEKGDTALIVAFKKGSLQMTNVLLSFGADPNIEGADGKTALELGSQTTNYENFQKYQAMQSVIRDKYKRKEHLKLLVDKKNNATVLNCDDLIETKYINACMEDKANGAWKIYDNQGQYKDYVFGLKEVYVGEKQYLISKGESYSIKDERWNTLRSGLKKVKPEAVSDGIVFNLTYEDKRKELFRP